MQLAHKIYDYSFNTFQKTYYMQQVCILSKLEL